MLELQPTHILGTSKIPRQDISRAKIISLHSISFISNKEIYYHLFFLHIPALK